MKHLNRWRIAALLALGALTSTSCEGMFGSIYDDAPATVEAREGQIVVDATSWTDWHYITLSQPQHITTLPIPTEGESVDSSGLYTYWFDVLGEGLQNNRFESFVPTAPQPDPEVWDIAVHRDNVRTNGGAVYETNYTSLEQLPTSNAWLADKTFVADEWSECDVWFSQEKMLQCLVPSQGIKVNRPLSSWFSIIKMPPPQYAHNRHVFIVRLKDGTHAALQLDNYLSAKGTTCHLTINYKYPY